MRALSTAPTYQALHLVYIRFCLHYQEVQHQSCLKEAVETIFCVSCLIWPATLPVRFHPLFSGYVEKEFKGLFLALLLCLEWQERGWGSGSQLAAPGGDAGKAFSLEEELLLDLTSSGMGLEGRGDLHWVTMFPLSSPGSFLPGIQM